MKVTEYFIFSINCLILSKGEEAKAFPVCMGCNINLHHIGNTTFQYLTLIPENCLPIFNFPKESCVLVRKWF